MTTGEKLQKLRKENGYTQEGLADTLGVSRQSISKWESDAAFPETDKLIALSKLYHCTVDYLLNVENEEASAAPQPKESGRKLGFSKKELPFVLSTAILCLLTIVSFALPCASTWRNVCTAQQCYSTKVFFSYFEIAFYRIRIIDISSIVNFIALMEFLVVLSNIIIVPILLFTGSKKLAITAKILNILSPLLILVSMMSFPVEWIGVQQVVIVVQTAFVICQFAIKPLRKA